MFNSIGDPHERLEHRSALVAYFTKQQGADLDDDSHRRLGTNPLRILDSKNPALQAVIAGAPKLVDCIARQVARALRRPEGAARPRPASRSRSIRGSCAGSTTTIAPSSNG